MEKEQNMEPEELSGKLRRYLTTALLVLLVLQTVTLPLAAGYAYAGPGGKVHQLTYTPGNLCWSSSVHVDPVTGVAELDLFQVNPQTGRKYIAPGMSGGGTVLLNNRSDDPVFYTAVLYRRDHHDPMPVTASMTAAHTDPVPAPVLPAGVTPDQVVTTLWGKVSAKETAALNVEYAWEFYASDLQDKVDTALGADSRNGITLGVYVVVDHLDSTYNPMTGDSSSIGMYVGLMIISFGLLVLLLIDRYMQKKWEEIREEE